MNTRPIIFNGAMVRAMLEGRKTQTRRIVKPPRRWPESSYCDPWVMAPAVWWWNGEHDRVGVRQDCPYGHPGDLLWVRETWAHQVEGCAWPHYPHLCTKSGWVWWRASAPSDQSPEGKRWRPSIHMPRWASRLTLRITNVRVERVQVISEADARAEGAPYVHHDEAFEIPATMMSGNTFPVMAHNYGFQNLWDSINAKRGYGWSDNPWVWVIEFEVIRSNVDEVMGATP